MSTAVARYESFKGHLEARMPDIEAVLPKGISLKRFRAVALSAATRQPEILNAKPNTLFGAITKAAQDGLLPDGREGVILSYGGEATWIPMVHGQRKRARELEDMIVQAEVVHQNDHFRFVAGDEPKLEHTPAPLGQDRGPAVGVYAIFRKNGEILHREIMDKQQIEAVKAKSKSPNGPLWKGMWGEAWRKTVIKRGFKAVPVGEAMDQIIERDNETYDFEGQAQPVAGLAADPAARLTQAIGMPATGVLTPPAAEAVDALIPPKSSTSQEAPESPVSDAEADPVPEGVPADESTQDATEAAPEGQGELLPAGGAPTAGVDGVWQPTYLELAERMQATQSEDEIAGVLATGASLSAGEQKQLKVIADKRREQIG